MDRKKRPYLSIYFRCCRVYLRVYRRPGMAKYVGWCPKCLGRVEIKIDPLGVDERFFEAYR